MGVWLIVDESTISDETHDSSSNVLSYQKQEVPTVTTRAQWSMTHHTWEDRVHVMHLYIVYLRSSLNTTVPRAGDKNVHV